jgi:hypothetical protein
MFHDEFFPTPTEVISQMMHPVREQLGSWYQMMVLDPSAGKGDILDWLSGSYNVNKQNLHAIEINGDLRAIIAKKGYTCVDSDFLQYRGRGGYNVIAMNPPWSNGDEHLLKAWDVMTDGYIVCILNAETLRNPHTERRKLLARIIEEHAMQPPKFIGQAFKKAERPTDAEAVIVWLHKKTERVFNFDGMKAEQDFVKVDDFNSNAPATRDFFEALVAQYNAAEDALKAMYESETKFAFYIKGVFDKYTADTEQSSPRYFQQRVTDLRTRFWQYLFDKSKINNIATSAVKEELERYINQNSNMAFSLHNIYEVMGRVMSMRGDIINKAITDAFDEATKYHRDTLKHTEGWKTNLSWRVGKKIIIPYGNPGSLHWYGSRARSFFEDLDKALCHLIGKRPDQIVGLLSTMEKHFGYGRGTYGGKFESEFFTFIVYWKGTVHLTFNDLDLLETFNLTAAKLKGMAVGDGTTPRAKPTKKRKKTAEQNSSQPSLFLGSGS